MQPKTIYFSSILTANPKYEPSAERLFTALDSQGIQYDLIDNTHDIWMLDFMPIQTKTGAYVSFKYEPCYLEEFPKLKTNYKQDISDQFSLPNITYSDINLDGGNVVFSPSKNKVIISDRVFSENSDRNEEELIQELEKLLEAQVIIIPSLESDYTGHADGMVRFVDENNVVGNDTDTKNGLEQRIKTVLKKRRIDVSDFSYFSSKGISAVGCYLNFLETDKYILLPVFDNEMDDKAVATAERIFKKSVVPININEIANDGGVLNCISWER